MHGQGFAQQAETRNLAVGYPAPVAGFFNVGVLHTALDGREGHAPYAPCTIDDLVARGYDYWALGHIHKRESVNGNRHPRIEFPGNLQGRHVREPGAKGCLLVTVDGNGQAVPEFRPLDVFRWEIVAVNAAAAESVADVLESARAAAVRCTRRRGRSAARGPPRHFLLRVHEPLPGVRPGTVSRRSCAGRPAVMCGSRRSSSRRFGTAQAEEPILSEDATSELRAVLDELRSQPDDARAVFASGDCGKLVNRLPPELRAAFEQSWDDVFARASALLQARPSEPAP